MCFDAGRTNPGGRLASPEVLQQLRVVGREALVPHEEHREARGQEGAEEGNHHLDDQQDVGGGESEDPPPTLLPNGPELLYPP